MGSAKDKRAGRVWSRRTSLHTWDQTLCRAHIRANPNDSSLLPRSQIFRTRQAKTFQSYVCEQLDLQSLGQPTPRDEARFHFVLERTNDRFILVDFDFATLLSSPFCSYILFAIVSGQLIAGILSAASRAEMADVEQMKKITHPVKQSIQSNSVGS